MSELIPSAPVWWIKAMKSLYSDFLLALRGFKRRPGFTLLAVLTLALGIGANVAVASLIHTLLLRPLPFPEAERLVRIMAFKGDEPGRLAQREIEELQRESEIFESVAAYYLSQYNLTGDGPPAVAPCAINSHELFSVLGAKFALGGSFNAQEDFRRQYQVILTHRLWQHRFGGDPEIVDKSIVLDGASYVVAGVLDAGSVFPPGVELYRQVTEYHGLDGRRHSVLARLKPGVSLGQAQQELARFAGLWQQQFPELSRGVHFEAVPIRDSWVGAARPYMWMLAGAVVFLLLIAVVNTAHLLLTRASERREELAVRLSLGANRWELVRPLLVESVVLAVFGGGLGLLMAGAGMRAFTGLVDADLPPWMVFRLDPSIVAVAVGLVLVAGILAGVAPALVSSRAVLKDGLRRTRGSGGGVSSRLRGTLVIGEIALALVLLAGAGLMIRSAMALEKQELGFDAGELFTFRVDPPYWSYQEVEQLTPFYMEAFRALHEIPGVTGVAANQNLPLAGLDENTKRILTLEGQSAEEQEANPFIHLQSIGPGYFDAMGIPLRQGRAFTNDDRLGSRPVAVVSARLAKRLWPQGALDQRLKLGPPESETAWMSVVGIVGDVHSEQRSGAASLDLYISHLQHYTGDTFFALRSPLDPVALERLAEQAIQKADPDLPLFDVAPMGERLARVEWQRRTTSRLFSIFAVLALVLAAVGTYGVMSYNVTLRRQEMGIRQALGARPRDLLTAVVQQGFRFLLRGLALGILVGLGLGQLIESLLFGVEATDALSLFAATFTLTLAVLLACLLPARRAARLDPSTAMRGENRGAQGVR